MYKRDTFCGFDIYEDVVNNEYVIFKKGDKIHDLFRGSKGDVYEYVLKNKIQRKPMERVNGRYKDKLEGMDEFCEKVAKDLCAEYPDIDILDLDNIFRRVFGYKLSLQLMKESAEVV